MKIQQWNYSNECTEPENCHSFQQIFSRGSYLLELWGACGGFSDPNYAGKGGYSKGIIHLKEETTFYIFVGQNGVTSHSNTPSKAA